MFEITLIAMGKLKEKFYLSAAAEYEKRMKGYCNSNYWSFQRFAYPITPPLPKSTPDWRKKRT